MPASRARVGPGALAVALAAVVLAAGSPLLLAGVGAGDAWLLTGAVQVLAAAGFSAAGALWGARWRLTGESAFGTTAVALLLLALIVFPLDQLSGFLFDSSTWQRASPVGWAFATPLVVALLWRGRGADEVNARLRPTALTVGLLSAVAVVFVVAAAFHRLLGVPLDPAPARVEVVEVVAAALWWAVAADRLVSGWRSGRLAAGWAASSMVLIGLACAYEAVATARGGAWVFGASALACVAGALAAWTSMGDLAEVFAHHGDRYVWLRGTLADTQQMVSDDEERRQEMLHDARSVIAAVRGAQHTLTRYGDLLAGDVREQLLEAVSSELARLDSLIDRPAQTVLEEFDARTTVEAVVAVQRRAGQDVRATLPPLPVYGNAADLGTVVANLLVNADRYAAGTPVTVWAEAASPATGSAVRLFVGDRGPGVPEEDRERVFRRGVRGTTTGGRVGSGLGLYISRRLVEAQGGRIELRERLGGGALFVISLPAAAAPARAQVGDAPVPAAPGAARPGPVDPLSIYTRQRPAVPRTAQRSDSS